MAGIVTERTVRLARLHPDDAKHYPATFIAVFVSTGLMVECPLAWTRRGLVLVRKHTHINGKGYDGVAVFEAACAMIDWADRPKIHFNNDGGGGDYAKNKHTLRRLTGDAVDKEAID